MGAASLFGLRLLDGLGIASRRHCVTNGSREGSDYGDCPPPKTAGRLRRSGGLWSSVNGRLYGCDDDLRAPLSVECCTEIGLSRGRLIKLGVSHNAIRCCLGVDNGGRGRPRVVSRNKGIGSLQRGHMRGKRVFGHVSGIPDAVEWSDARSAGTGYAFESRPACVPFGVSQAPCQRWQRTGEM